jgi:hypothetical protein
VGLVLCVFVERLSICFSYYYFCSGSLLHSLLLCSIFMVKPYKCRLINSVLANKQDGISLG